MLRYLRLASACLFIASCAQSPTNENPETFKVIHPFILDTTYTVEYVAEIQSVHYAEVRTRVKGYIEKIHVDEGKDVSVGELLFSINSKEFEQHLQKASATVKSAEAELKALEMELFNANRLFERDIVSKAEMELVAAKVEAQKANVEAAMAEKEQAALSLSFSRIKAPYGGVINRIPKKVGSLVDEGDMLTSISDSRNVFAYFNLSESDYLNYLMGDQDRSSNTIRLRLANNELYEHTGKIEIIESEFDPTTGNIAFRARFPNPNKILKHGSSGKILVERPLRQAMLVPQKSTFEIQDKLYVYVVKQDSVLELRNIIPKNRIPDYYILQEGLQVNERFVYEGVQKIKAGQKISPELLKLVISSKGN